MLKWTGQQCKAESNIYIYVPPVVRSGHVCVYIYASHVQRVKRQRVSMNTCRLATAHVYHFLWSICWFYLVLQLSITPLTITSGFIKKQRAAVGPRLTDTPQQWTPMIYQAIPKVPTVLPFTWMLKQSLNSRHPTTPYNGQFSQFNFVHEQCLMTSI